VLANAMYICATLLGSHSEDMDGKYHSTLGFVRFYPNSYRLREIERVSIPSKSKSLTIRINPLQSIYID
jgi:hypothetical protein